MTPITEDIIEVIGPAISIDPPTSESENIVEVIGPAISIGPPTPAVEPPVIAREDLADGIVGIAGGTEVSIGTPGNDVLIGTPGNDLISGAGGNDTINGYGDGVGEIDILTGGAGADTFVIDMSNFAYAEDGHAIITDFQKGIDRLDLTGFEDFVTLGTSNSDNGVDTSIFENGDLLAVVQGVELSQNDFNNSLV